MALYDVRYNDMAPGMKTVKKLKPEVRLLLAITLLQTDCFCEPLHMLLVIKSILKTS